MENNQQSFWQFSDQLRNQNNNGLATLSLNNDSIWGNSYVSKKPERRNFDTRVNMSKNEPNLRSFDSFDSTNAFNPKESDFNFNEGFKKFDKFDSTKAFKSKETELNKGFRKFDIRVGGELNSVNSPNTLNAKETDFNGFNHNWKIGGADLNGFNLEWKSNLNSGFNNIGAYSKPSIDYKLDNNRNLNNNNNFNVNTKGYFKKSEDDHHFNQHNNNNHHHGVGKFGKKNKNSNKDSNKDSEKDNKNSVEKRFKTLPPSESLPRDETIGGYIFVCNNDTMEENLQRQLFGLPPRYRDSVRSITPGLPLFLYNYSTHQLHGIYEASSFGGTNIDASAWEDKKNPGESRFPAQVRVMTRKICEPLEEDSFRPILHHYDGPKFRLELNIPEVLSLLDIFSEK